MKFHALIAGCLLAGLASPAGAVIFLETDDPLHNTTTPGDNSGWQYEGKFGDFLGVPIAPYFFITAKHIGGGIGNVLDFHGDSYTVIASHPSPTTDLQIWEVDHSKPFPTFAPLASAAGDTMTTATVIGRGTQRGVPVTVGEVLKGWKWGSSDHVQRWGRNEVEGVLPGGPGIGELLFCNFNAQALPDECHLSVGDSGGGMFVLENGLWRLAGVHYSVEGPFRHDSSETPFDSALFDTGGLEAQNGGWMLVPDGDEDVPSGFLSSRISSSLAWIRSVTGGDGSLPDESYSAWQRLYFTPAQVATPAITGPAADYDNDGVGNLLEFALNLDPTFNERAIMVANNGLRGLPLVRVETISGADRVTIEFVRRTAASGSGLRYGPLFSSDLAKWDAVGTVNVVAINPRWERVKIVDALTTSATMRRFVRLDVTLTE
ncbi:MAG: hypothetical protein V4675_03590 [Verrucomicrobiota bacterium]